MDYGGGGGGDDYLYTGPDNGEGYDFATPENNLNFNDSTTVTGSGPGTLPSRNPFSDFPYNDPRDDQFPQPNVGGGGGGFNLGDFLKGAAPSVGKLQKLTPKQAAALALLAQQLLGSHGQQSMADLLKQNPSLDSLMKLQSSQAQRQDPLHQAVTQLATNLLPNSAFGAGPNRPVIR